MGNENRPKKDDVLISLNDIVRLIKRESKKILAGAAICALLMALYILTKPIQYNAEASFRDKGKQKASPDSTLLTLLGGISGIQENEAVSVLTSRKIVAGAVAHLGMQASLTPQRTPGTLSNMKNIIRAEYAHWTKRKTPILPDNPPRYFVRDLLYKEEVPLSLSLKMKGEKKYEVIDGKKELLGVGTIGEKFISEKVRFTLVENPASHSDEVDFNLYIQPLENYSKNLRKSIKIRPDKDDKSLLVLGYNDTDRQRCCHFLNAVMSEYQKHLKHESEKISKQQIDYLKNRQEESFVNMKELLDEYAGALSSTFFNSGFPDSDKEMEFFAKMQQEYKLNLLNVELESKRLQMVRSDDLAHFDKYTRSGDAEVINQILAEIRRLKQQRDTMSLALDDLDHKDDSNNEFSGINLTTAYELYCCFNKQISDIQANIRQHQFILEQMDDPSFEISSLATLLHDGVSQEMVAKAGRLTLDVKDTNNRSAKEIERLQEELEVQRKFLTSHVENIAQLNTLSEKLLNNKLAAIQRVSLDLIDQQVGILEKHLVEYVKTRLENLKQERQVIEQHVALLKTDMPNLPKKWVSEQVMKQKVKINTGILEEVIRLVESKNITSNLEAILSAPLDQAIPPVLPNNPRLVIYTVIAAVFGAFMSFGFLLVQTISRGFPASIENLKLENQNVAGVITKRCSYENRKSLLDTDLDTLRCLMNKFVDYKIAGLGEAIVVIQGEESKYGLLLAFLLAKQKHRVIALDISFNNAAANHTPGLLQYFEGNEKEPFIQKGEYFDTIAAGGVSRFSTEYLRSRAFRDLLDSLEYKYDFVIVISSASPKSAEAESLLGLHATTVVTLSDETLPELTPYLSNSNKTIFVFHE